MPDLVDASVWVPLSAPDHVHHSRALRYWESEAAQELAFCRLTVLALLRHLTNPQVLGNVALGGTQAWQALKTWLVTPGIIVLAEPSGLDEVLAGWSLGMELRGAQWTDAYLAAFAMAGGYRMVAFDNDFYQFPGLDFLHLKTES